MGNQSMRVLAEDLMTVACCTPRGRLDAPVPSGHGDSVQQTLVALPAGAGIDESAYWGDVTFYVVVGRVHVTAGGRSQAVSTGDLLVIPQSTYAITALEDSAMLLTVVRPA